ncbi:MAG: metallophosphoesterase family protein [Pseudomonadota bacterium]
MTFSDAFPLLVFGGPYSNLQATTGVLAEARARAIPPQNIICTGDVVAYCGDPDATAARIREAGIRVVAGNCEEQLAADADDCGCGFDEGTACDRLSRDWYAFASRATSIDSRAWMAGLPRRLDGTYRGRSIAVIHGTEAASNQFLFGSETQAIRDAHAAVGADVVIAGHCGLPFAQAVGGGGWFNPGVVGVPANDGTCDVWFGTITPEPDSGLTFATHRLGYDHTSAAHAMRRSGHADPYAEALETGLWPSLDVLPRAERAATGQPIAEVRLRLPASASLASVA